MDGISTCARSSAAASSFGAGIDGSSIWQLTTAFFRDRDLFVHDGSKLRRLRLSASVQAVFFLILLMLVAWASYRDRPPHHPSGRHLQPYRQRRSPRAPDRAAPGPDRSRAQRRPDRSALLAQAAAGGRVANNGPLARVEQQQLAAGGARRQSARRPLSGHRRRAEEARHHPGPRRRRRRRRTVRKRRQRRPSRQLFNSWKKLDQLQDGVIAIPSDKPVQASVDFTSGFGVRSDPFHAGAAMHPGIDLAGSYGTPIYATADGTVLRAGWNSRRLRQSRRSRPRPRHHHALRPHVGDHG